MKKNNINVFLSTLIEEYSDVLRKIIKEYKIYKIDEPYETVMDLHSNKKYSKYETYGIISALNLRAFNNSSTIDVLLVELACIKFDYKIVVSNSNKNIKPYNVLCCIKTKMDEILKEKG